MKTVNTPYGDTTVKAVEFASIVKEFGDRFNTELLQLSCKYWGMGCAKIPVSDLTKSDLKAFLEFRHIRFIFSISRSFAPNPESTFWKGQC